MTLSNSDMIERFLNRRINGKASRMKIRVVNGYICIEGYDWALYAVDTGDYVALFGDGYATHDTDVGWAGYSGTTTHHLQLIKRALERENRDYRVVDYQLQTSELRDYGVSIPEMVENHEVEPRD